VISGSVDERLNLLVPLTVKGFNGQELSIQAVLDTGFSNWLSLTDEQVQFLGLLPSGTAESALADGSVVPVVLYMGIVVWEGIERLVEVVGGDTDPLLGVKLLEGNRLVVDFRSGGTIEIQSAG
jgi:clan AA aspartic protease